MIYYAHQMENAQPVTATVPSHELATISTGVKRAGKLEPSQLARAKSTLGKLFYGGRITETGWPTTVRKSA